jgi:hypothetical protein
MVTINFSESDELAPLYCKYEGQHRPQSAHIVIDPEACSVDAYYYGEIGNVMPMSVYLKHILRLSLPANAKGSAIQAFLSDADTQALIDRICDGYKERWDGNNYVGSYSDDADAAIAALESEIEEEFADDSDSVIEVWDAGVWIAGCGLNENWKEDQSLSEFVSEAEADIGSGVYLYGDLKDALLDQVDSEIDILDPTEGERLPEFMWADLLAEDADKYGPYCCPVAETEEEDDH